MKILIVEDDLISRRIMESCLSDYELLTASDGAEAWDIFINDDAIRMAVLDWMLPEMHGIDLCRRIRELEKAGTRRKHTYILIATARKEKKDIVAGLNAGADDYVTKPFSQSELKARIEVGKRIIDLENNLEKRIDELEAALNHLKRLQGLLPICSYCKRIRDEENYWHQVEAYLSEYGDILFTHSICPNCMKIYYQDLEES